VKEISFPSTWDRVIDTLLAYSIMDLSLTVDKNVKFKLMIGNDVFLTVMPSLSIDIFKKVFLKNLEKLSKSFIISKKLNFNINVGNKFWAVDPATCIYCYGRGGKCDFHGKCGKPNIPAYAVFSRFVRDAIKLGDLSWGTNPITKRGIPREKHDHYGSLYLSISPYWSKGLRRWNQKWRDSSTKVSHPIPALTLYGLAKYAISEEYRGKLFQLIFSPPIGELFIGERAINLLTLIKRIINQIFLKIDDIFASDLPIITLPLIFPCLLDISAIYCLYENSPSILFINYDMARGSPKNPRGYEEICLADTLEFFIKLGSAFWSFKRFILDLIRISRKEKYRSIVKSILIEIVLGIKNKDATYINDAIISAQSLRDEISLYVPEAKRVIMAHKAII